MSLKAARDFVEKAIHSEEIKKEAHSGKKEILDIGRKHGYEFNHAELGQAMREREIEPRDDDPPDTCCICI